MTTEELKNKLSGFIKEKKIDSLEELYVADKTVLADYFLIATVRNNLQVRMLNEFLEESAEKEGIPVLHKDGEHASGWIVMDFGGVIVHIFTIDKKEYYSLDKFWKNKDKQ